MTGRCTSGSVIAVAAAAATASTSSAARLAPSARAALRASSFCMRTLQMGRGKYGHGWGRVGGWVVMAGCGRAIGLGKFRCMPQKSAGAAALCRGSRITAMAPGSWDAPQVDEAMARWAHSCPGNARGVVGACSRRTAAQAMPGEGRERAHNCSKSSRSSRPAAASSSSAACCCAAAAESTSTCLMKSAYSCRRAGDGTRAA